MKNKLVMILTAMLLFSAGCSNSASKSSSDAEKETVEEVKEETSAETTEEPSVEITEEPVEEKTSEEREEIEITFENWKEYFDVRVFTTCYKNSLNEDYFTAYVGLAPKEEYKDRINYPDSFCDAFAVKLKYTSTEKEASLDENENVVLGQNVRDPMEMEETFDFGQNSMCITSKYTGEKMVYIAELGGTQTTVVYADSVEVVNIVGKFLVLEP